MAAEYGQGLGRIHQRLEAELQAWLGSDAAVVCTGVNGDPERLCPQERGAIARAVPKRQREFAAGRSAARTAMQRIGWPAAAIPSHPDRAPQWPEGLVGSIAHSSDTCLAAVGLKTSWMSLGIDIEPDRGIEASLWDSICTPEELLQLEQMPPVTRPLQVTRVFVAKEAFYKWHYPIHRTVLEFHEVSVHWQDGGSGFEIAEHVGHGLLGTVATGRGRLFAMDGHVAAGFATRTGLL